MMNPKTQYKSDEKEKRIPGSAKGKIFLADDFEQPLDDESMQLFYQ